MNGKVKLILIAVVILAVIAAAFYFLSIGQSGKSKEVVLVSGGANWTKEQHFQIQQNLVNVIGSYTEAVLMTNAVFSVDAEKTSYKEWYEKVEKAVSLWREVEDLGNKMDGLLAETGVSSKDLIKRSALNDLLGSLLSVASANSDGENVSEPNADQIIAVFDSAKQGEKINAIMDAFEVDKNTAMDLLERELGQTASDYNKKGDLYERCQNAAKVIKHTSKVVVFIGANIVTGGGASAAVGTVQGVTMAVSGVSLAVDVGKEINIALGNKKNAAVLQKAQDTAAPITEIISIASLSDIGNPENLFYLAEKTEDLSNLASEGCVWLNRDEEGNLTLKKGEKPEDGGESAAYGLPPGYYNLNGQRIEVKEMDAEMISQLYGNFEGADLGEEFNLRGEVTASPLTYTLPGVDERTHKMRGGGSIRLNVNVKTGAIVGQCSISARDYWKCPPDSECGGDWLASAATPVNITGRVFGEFNPETGEISGRVNNHSFTGRLVGKKAKGYFFYELPSGGSAFFWEADVSN